MIVVIDDERTFETEEDVLYLRTADEAIAWFANRWVALNRRPYGISVDDFLIEQVWFDHDLGENSRPAADVALFIRTLSDLGRWIPIRSIFVHSQNPVGAERLVGILEPCGIFYPVRCGLPPLKTT